MLFELLTCRLLVETGGFASMGWLEKMIRIEGVGITIASWDKTIAVDVLERQPDGNFTERRTSPPLAALEALVTDLRALNFPAQAPALEEVIDTGDGWERITLMCELDRVQRTWSLQMQWSGFKGPDADRWRALFAHILELAGVEDRGYSWARR